MQGYKSNGGGEVSDIHFENIFGHGLHTAIAIDLAIQPPLPILPVAIHRSKYQAPPPEPPTQLNDLYFHHVALKSVLRSFRLVNQGQAVKGFHLMVSQLYQSIFAA